MATPPTRAASTAFLLLALFVVSLLVSLALVQVVAALLVVSALLMPGARSREEKLLWTVAAVYILALGTIAIGHDGAVGFLDALRRTWMILCAPAAASLAARIEERQSRALRVLLVAGFTLSAVIFLGQWVTGDPAVTGRYGFHTSPYHAGLLMIPASLFLFMAVPLGGLGASGWILMAVAMALINVRGTLVAWLTGMAVIAAFRRFDRRLLRRFAVVALLIFVVTAQILGIGRWGVWNLEGQSSIQKRLAVWGQVIGQWTERPLFGYGFDKFVSDPTRAAPRYVEFLTNETNPHSGYLMVLHAAGLAGFAVLWFAFGLVLKTLHARARDGQAWALVAYANLVALLVAALSDKTFFATQPSLAAWFLAGFALGVPREERKRER